MGLVLEGVEEKVEDFGSVVDDLVEGFRSFFDDEIAGIFCALENGDANFEVDGDEGSEGAFGGGLAGGIAVKEYDDLVGEAADEGDVIGAEGGSEDRDGSEDPGLDGHDDVGVAFNDDEASDAGFFGVVEAVEDAAFFEEAGDF